MKPQRIGPANQPAITVHPELLLEYLGEAGAALRYNPGGFDAHTGRDEEARWEVYEIGQHDLSAYLIGSGETPLAAMLEAAATLLGYEDEACIIEPADMTPENTARLQGAITAAQRFLKELRA